MRKIIIIAMLSAILGVLLSPVTDWAMTKDIEKHMIKPTTSFHIEEKAISGSEGEIYNVISYWVITGNTAVKIAYAVGRIGKDSYVVMFGFDGFYTTIALKFSRIGAINYMKVQTKLYMDKDKKKVLVVKGGRK